MKKRTNISVAITADESYPVYNLEKIKRGEKPSAKLKLPIRLFNEYQSVTKRVNELHVAIRTLVEQQHLSP
jgi:hypothetical protein